MKRLFPFAIIFLCLCFLSSCKDMDYKKACNEHDWDKAYAILHEMEKDVDAAREDVDEAHEDLGKEPRYDVERGFWGDLYHTPRKGYEIASGKWEAKYQEYMETKKKYDEAEHYVVLHEGLFLLERGDDESLMRIAFLVKERKASYLWDELIDVAKSFDDKSLYNKLMRMSGKNNDSDTNKDSQESSVLDE